ncbi:MAG: hypothetical protein J7K68_03925 [Candidatus Diapherotrites archaeon]|nr:hypothetical protein [Candidatus Diapherotrites archaeon]
MKGKFLLLLLISSVFAYNVTAYFFWGQGCPHCAKEEPFLEQMEAKYPEFHAERFEIYRNTTNRALFKRTAEAYNTTIQGVPTLFIGNKVIVGWDPRGIFGEPTPKAIENTIKECITYGCPSPGEKIENATFVTTKEVSPVEGVNLLSLVSAVIAGSAVDAINPCAFAVLIILLTTILVAGDRFRVLKAGIAFSLAIFISYFLMGLGLFSAIQWAGATRTIYYIVGALAVVVGLLNIKDYLRYGGGGFVMEVPQSWRPTLKRIIKSVTSAPGAFFIGFIVSLFLLPCTSGPYIVVLGLLARRATQALAIMLLLLYNAIFILPMLFITFMVYKGLSPERVEKWRKGKLRHLHLVAGIIILGLGIALLMGVL